MDRDGGVPMILGRTPEGLIKTKSDGGLRAVNCACCAGGCCMYPAQALADEIYGANDLPDAVTIGGVSYSRSGSGYGNATNGVLLEADAWARYTNGSRSSRACLIQSGVEDQFEATYNTQGQGFLNNIGFIDFDIVVTRRSLCIWESDWVDLGEGARYMITLLYDYQNKFSGGYKWTLLAVGESLDGGGVDFCFKDPYQNTPVGEYPIINNMSGTVS